MKKFLVAFDGSEASRKAARTATRFAKEMSGEITLISVIPEIVLTSTPFMRTTIPYEERESIIDSTKEELKKFEETLKDHDLKLNAVVKFGDVAEEIALEAKEGNYDLIVMGDRGWGSVKRVILGSTANKVLVEAPVPVLIVK